MTSTTLQLKKGSIFVNDNEKHFSIRLKTYHKTGPDQMDFTSSKEHTDSRCLWKSYDYSMSNAKSKNFDYFSIENALCQKKEIIQDDNYYGYIIYTDYFQNPRFTGKKS